jgi:Tfp pilus assembly protein PilN
MEAIKLDYLDDGRNIWIGIVILAVGLCGTLFMAWNYHEENLKISQQEMLVASVKNGKAIRMDVLPSDKDANQVASEIKQANAIILELNLPWKELFSALESYNQNDVAVLSIEPDAQQGLVRINAEAKSLDSLLAYIAYLQKVSLFQDVALLNHQIQEQDPQKPVRFMLQATWGARL